MTDCPVCDHDDDLRPATEEREGVPLCAWHALAYDFGAPAEVLERVAREARVKMAGSP